MLDYTSVDNLGNSDYLLHMPFPIDDQPDPSAPVKIPINGTLDLHTFRPSDVSSLVQEYLTVCREKGILSIRIIHGKGKGVLRETVHAALKKVPFVASCRLGDETSGSWGATLVELKRS
jgi:DNA-nicking Smr family endonuclease